MNELIQQHPYRAAERMKRQADKKRSEHSFTVDGTMFLKLQPYSSVQWPIELITNFSSSSMDRMIEKVWTITYRLQLPLSSAIHLVFHVSQLKKVLTNNL
jgi:hypothetical protein